MLASDTTFDESLPANTVNAVAVDDPSPAALLERAAMLGPPRTTWESIVLPDDPVLGEKMKPRVAERRARLRTVVKATVGVCVALCIAAVAASAIAGGSDSAKTTTSAIGKTAPAIPVVTIEKIDDAKRSKASSTRTAAANAFAKAMPSMKSKRH